MWNAIRAMAPSFAGPLRLEAGGMLSAAARSVAAPAAPPTAAPSTAAPWAAALLPAAAGEPAVDGVSLQGLSAPAAVRAPLVRSTIPTDLPFRDVDVRAGTIGYTDRALAAALAGELEARGITLVAVRHGQSEVNAAGTNMCGQMETPLSPLGRQQAQDAAARMYEQLGGDDWLRGVLRDGRGAPAIYSSPLSRAHDTALAAHDLLAARAAALAARGLATSQAVGDFTRQIAIRTDDRLMELGFGHYEGRPVADLMGDHPEFGAGRVFTLRFPGGESGVDVMVRMASFLRDVAARHAQQPVLLYTHQMPVGLGRILLGQGETVDGGALWVNRATIKNADPMVLVQPRAGCEGGWNIAAP